MDQEEKNLVYFYHLINEYLEIHLQKKTVTKKDIRDITLSNDLVNHLETIFEQEKSHEETNPESQE